MTNEEFVIHLKKKKYLILFLLIVFFIASLYVQYLKYNNYKSSVDFTITANEALDLGSEGSERERLHLEAAGVSKIYSFIYSTELLDHLIEKYNLYKHFHIDMNDPYHYENVIDALLSSIAVKKTDFGMMTITVTHRNRDLAADMANDIVNQVNVIFRNKLLSKNSQKVTFYENMLKDVQLQDSIQRGSLENVIQEVKETSHLLNHGDAQYEKLSNQLMSITQRLQNNNENFSKAFQLYRAAYASLESYDLQAVEVLRKALPEKGSHLFRKLIISSMATLIFFSFICICYYYYLDNKRLIKLIFSRSDIIHIKQSSS